MTRYTIVPVALALAITCAGCHVDHRDIGRAPHMSPTLTTSGDARVTAPNAALPPSIAHAPRSTWSDRAADLFRDARAIRHGDILTVKISIKDKASFDSSANRSRDSKLGSQGSMAFGLNAFGVSRSGDGSLDASSKSNTSSEGKGSVTRSENMELLVAATVRDILPNGNLLIAGTQEMRVNFEVRVLQIEGIVRPRDISTDNSVSYEKVAEARVSYGGRGRSSEILQPPIGQQVIDLIAPF